MTSWKRYLLKKNGNEKLHTSPIYESPRMVISYVCIGLSCPDPNFMVFAH
jgi:hypothetical protein